LQGNIDNPPPSILLIFGYVVAYQKIRNTYFFYGRSYLGENNPQKSPPKNNFLKISSVVIDFSKIQNGICSSHQKIEEHGNIYIKKKP